MALAKKKIVKKAVVKKAVVKKVVAKKAVAKKAPVKKVVKKKVLAKKKPAAVAAGRGKYAYEPYREKKNVGNCAKNACLQGKDTNEVISIVIGEFPECNISSASVGYYRSALRREGYDL